MTQQQVFHAAVSRGLADHGWLVSRHTFSFADYYDPKRMNFGLLRVLNDDIVQPGMGFGTHPHENMEIISIPLSGALQHADSMGNKGVIRAGEVQVMSAGSGLTHSEFNASTSDEVNFLQIWVYPEKKNIEPRYGQLQFAASERRNRFQLLVAPERSEQTIWINQDAWLSLADLQAGTTLVYEKRRSQSGVYFFIIEGEVILEGTGLRQRDGLGLTAGERLQIDAKTDAKLLVIEVPLHP